MIPLDYFLDVRLHINFAENSGLIGAELGAFYRTAFFG
jgi:hypothetical protein